MNYEEFIYKASPGTIAEISNGKDKFIVLIPYFAFSDDNMMVVKIEQVKLSLIQQERFIINKNGKFTFRIIKN